MTRKMAGRHISHIASATVTVALILGAVALGVAGCGPGSANAVGHYALLRHDATLYARAVNLRARDVPGYRAAQTAQAGAQSRCSIDRLLTGAPAGVSPLFESEEAVAGGTGGYLSSIVFVLQSDAIARHAANAIWEEAGRGAIGRCLKRRREKARLYVHGEGMRGTRKVGGRLFGDMRPMRLKPPVTAAGVYGVRTAGRYFLNRRANGEWYSNDLFAIAAGRAVVLLDGVGVGKPIAMSTERHLLLILRGRAFGALRLLAGR